MNERRKESEVNWERWGGLNNFQGRNSVLFRNVPCKANLIQCHSCNRSDRDGNLSNHFLTFNNRIGGLYMDKQSDILGLWGTLQQDLWDKYRKGPIIERMPPGVG